MGIPYGQVLVTGGAGFIGSHTVERLVQEGVRVRVLDNFSTGSESNLARLSGPLEVLRGDILDERMVERAVQGVDAVIHQAAVVNVQRSIQDPVLVMRTNVEGTVRLLRAAVQAAVKRFIYASSSAVYGETQELPKREEQPPHPISPYGASKLAAEGFCRSFYHVYGLEAVCLRYFNVYGPRQSLGPYSAVIPIFTGRILRGERPVIFGDGHQTRDFTFVADVVEANCLALAASGAAGEVLNIATGRETSVIELAHTLLSLLGRPKLQVEYSAPRPGDIRRSCADVTKSARLLGYRPKVALEEGLRRFTTWLQAGGRNSPVPGSRATGLLFHS